MQIPKLVVVVEEVVVVNFPHFSRELGRRSSASLRYLVPLVPSSDFDEREKTFSVAAKRSAHFINLLRHA